MSWTISFDMKLAGVVDLADASEKYLDALTTNPDVIGAVTSADLSDGTVGAQFDVEASDAVSAFHAGSSANAQALDAAGFRDHTITHVEMMKDETQLHAPDRQLAHS